MLVWIFVGLLSLANAVEAVQSADHAAASLWLFAGMASVYMTHRSWVAFRKFTR